MVKITIYDNLIIVLPLLKGVSELATETNLESIVRQTHLELTEALRGTKPFCSII